MTEGRDKARGVSGGRGPRGEERAGVCPLLSDAAMMKGGCDQAGEQHAGPARVEAGIGAENSNPLTRPCSFWPPAHTGCYFREHRGLTWSGVRNPGHSASIPSPPSPLLPSLPSTVPSSSSSLFPLIVHTWSLASPFHPLCHCLGITFPLMFTITTAPYLSRHICRRAGISSGFCFSAQNL